MAPSMFLTNVLFMRERNSGKVKKRGDSGNKTLLVIWFKVLIRMSGA